MRGRVESVEFGAAGGHAPELGEFGGGGQARGDLRGELGPVAAGDDGDVGDAEEGGEGLGHGFLDGLFADCQGAVEIEGDEFDHGGGWKSLTDTAAWLVRDCDDLK